MKLHLIDGTFELFRVYYGAPSSRAPDGTEVGATKALVRSLFALLRRDEVTHVAVAFDHVIESFRNDLFAGYKTSAGVEPELLAQFQRAERATAAVGLVVWPMVEFEADDAMATAAARWRDQVDQVVLASPDKDLAQCVVGDRVVAWDRIRDVTRDEAGVVEKFGVAPASIPDYLSLVGDSADGLPGLPRWGAKSTAIVLSRYRHIENIPDDPATWDVKVRGAAALAQVLAERRDDAMLYKQLATLRTDVPLTESLDDLRWRGADREALEAIAAELGTADLVERAPAFR